MYFPRTGLDVVAVVAPGAVEVSWTSPTAAWPRIDVTCTVPVSEPGSGWRKTAAMPEPEAVGITSTRAGGTAAAVHPDPLASTSSWDGPKWPAVTV